MSERMVAFDGTVDVHSQPGHGTRVTAQLAGDLED
jgi:signal transduction histidine kinase